MTRITKTYDSLNEFPAIAITADTITDEIIVYAMDSVIFNFRTVVSDYRHDELVYLMDTINNCVNSGASRANTVKAASALGCSLW